MQQNTAWKAHLAMFTACAVWGLMSPVGKDAMAAGISGFMMVTFRMTGAAVSFWITSLFTQHEKVCTRDLCLFFFAALLGIVFNQCCFTIGLSLTSPINASIVTTTMPLITMLLAAIFLHEPITGKKVIGILAGASGAILLIRGSLNQSGNTGNLAGDLLCLTAQCSFAVYLTLFKHLIQRYTVVTCMKWMFTYASLVVLPFTYSDFISFNWSSISPRVWGETAFVVFGATYIAYLLVIRGQQYLRPTVVSMYTYVQPLVACIVSVLVGLGVFGWTQGIAVALIFSGVWLVTRSKSRADLLREQSTKEQVTS